MELPADLSEHYCAKWALGALVPLAVTNTGTLFRATHEGGAVVLKILTPAGAADEAGGAVFLTACAGRGAVRLLAHDAGAQLLEFCDGPTLREMVASGRDEDATRIMAQCLCSLHGTKVAAKDAARLVPLERRFRALIDRSQDDPCRAYGAQVACDLLAEAMPPVALHGDMHHENVMKSTGRGWLAIDPKGVWGDPYYDYANAFLNPVGMDGLVAQEARMRRMAEIFASENGLDAARLLRFAFVHACLSACWSLEDGDDPSLAMRCAGVLRACCP